MSDSLRFDVDSSPLVRAVRALDQVATASEKAEAAATELVAATRKVGQADAALLAPVAQATQATGRFTDAMGRLREANGRFVSAATLAKEAAEREGRAHEQAASGARDQSTALDRLGGQARKVGGELRGLAAAVGLAFSAREAMNVADAYTTMVSRLRLVTASEQERTTTLRTLNAIADRTRTQVTDTADLYIKLRQANEGLGFTTAQTADLTEAFGLALKVSGASGATASSAITQFAQAMSKGAATGDEFVTISEAAPEVLRIVQRELGVSRARLLEMREAGELTSKVIGDALLKNLDRLRGQVGDAPRTIADGFVALRNGVIRLLGSSQDLQTATRNIAEGLANVGRFLETNGPILVGLAKAAALFWGVSKAVGGVTTALAALNGAAAAGGAAAVIRNLVTLAGGPFGFAVKAAALAVGAVEVASANAAQARAENLSERRESFRRLSPEQQARTMQALEAERRRLQAQYDSGRTSDGALLLGERRATLARAIRTNRENLDLFRELGVGTNRVTVMAAPDLPTSAGGKSKPTAPKVPKERDFDLFGAKRAYREKLADFDRDIADGAARDNEEIRKGFARRADALAQEAAERARAITQAIVDGLQRTLADGLVGIFTRGLKSLGDFMEQVKQTILRTFAQIVANEITRRLLKYITDLSAARREDEAAGGSGTIIRDDRRGMPTGFTRGLQLAGALGSIFTPPGSRGGNGGGFPVLSYGGRNGGGLGDVIPGAPSGGGPGGVGTGTASQGATPYDGLKILLGKKVPLLGGVTGGGLLAGGAAGLGGFALGNAFGRRFGTRGGIAAGAATGAALGTIIPGIGNVVGAVIGGLAGAVGGLFGGRARRRQQRAEAEARRETETAFREDLAARNAAANGDDSEAARLRLLAQQRAELAQAIRQFGSASALVNQLRATQAAELRALTDSALGPGTYLAPAGFDPSRARFDAGRPVSITGPVTIAVPEGTTQEQAVGIVRALQDLATAQGLPASGWADVQVS